MSWEDDDFEPPSVSASKRWEGEDKEENESWENLTTKSVEPEKKSTEIVKPKDKKKAALHKAEVITSQPLDPLDEKKRQQQLVEASDFQNTQAMFSGLDLGKDLMIDVNNPKDEKDFEVLAEVLGQKICSYEKSYHFKNLLKNLLRKTTASLKPEEIKDLASVLTVIANEKLKAEKPKKKKASTKKTVNMKDSELDNELMDEYSDFM